MDIDKDFSAMCTQKDKRYKDQRGDLQVYTMDPNQSNGLRLTLLKKNLIVNILLHNAQSLQVCDLDLRHQVAL